MKIELKNVTLKPKGVKGNPSFFILIPKDFVLNGQVDKDKTYSKVVIKFED